MALISFAVASSATRANATGIVYQCDSTIASDGAAGMCNYLNNQIAGVYASLFSDANADIYIEFGPNVQLSENVRGATTDVSYNQYLTALAANSSGDSIDTAAIASLPLMEPGIYGNIALTSALASALGIGGTLSGETAELTGCTLPGTGDCYDGVIVLATPTFISGFGESYYYRDPKHAQASNAFDIYSLIEHETDEVLGTASCVTDVRGVAAFAGCGGVTNAAPVDLFRYSSNGVRTPYPSNNAAYFSYNGGKTSVANYNFAENGEDYGDFNYNCLHVQDATGCEGSSLDIATDGGAEVTILDGIGYNRAGTVVAPEPVSIGLFGAGLALLGCLTPVRRRAGRRARRP